MANLVQLKKSSVAAKIPLTTDLSYGELALNYADGKLYYKKSDGITIDYFPSVTSLSSVYLPLTGGTMTGAITFAAGQTWPTFNQSTTGNAATASTSGLLSGEDNRAISPSELGTSRLKFGFTSWTNNSASPYADFLHLRSYTDSSGGNDNLVMFRKDAIGMRIWQQAFGSATAYASYKDVAFTDSNITGSAATLTTGRTIAMTGDVTYTSGSFNGSANVTGTATLATVNSNVGTYNNVTVNAKGLVTAASNVSYLTTESDTLSTVTGRGSTTTSNIQLNNSALLLAVSAATKIAKQAVTPANITVNTISTLDTWATATYRSAKYTIQVTQGTKYQVSEVRMLHDGTNVVMNEYSVLETNAASPIPVTFSAAIATGTLTLSATITNAATTNASIIIERTLFAV
jgi:hypothetical protein